MSNLYSDIMKQDHIEIARNAVFALIRIREMSRSVRNSASSKERTCTGIDPELLNAIEAAMKQKAKELTPDFLSPGNIQAWKDLFRSSPCKRTVRNLESIGFLVWAEKHSSVVRKVKKKIESFGDKLIPDLVWFLIATALDEYLDFLAIIPPNVVDNMESAIIKGSWGQMEQYLIDTFGERQCVDVLAEELTKYHADLDTSRFKQEWELYNCADTVLTEKFSTDLHTEKLYNYGEKYIGIEYDEIMDDMFIDVLTGNMDYDKFFKTMGLSSKNAVRKLGKVYTMFNKNVNYSITAPTNKKSVSTLLSFT